MTTVDVLLEVSDVISKDSAILISKYVTDVRRLCQHEDDRHRRKMQRKIDLRKKHYVLNGDRDGWKNIWFKPLLEWRSRLEKQGKEWKKVYLGLK
jgi:hypothetical protein